LLVSLAAQPLGKRGATVLHLAPSRLGGEAGVLGGLALEPRLGRPQAPLGLVASSILGLLADLRPLLGQSPLELRPGLLVGAPARLLGRLLGLALEILALVAQPVLRFLACAPRSPSSSRRRGPRRPGRPYAARRAA